MKLTLMASVPCKRFDFAPLCEDGRGGWTFSQFGADRYAASPGDYAIKLGLAVWATPTIQGDCVEVTELVAYRGEHVLGTNSLDWRRPNNGGAHHDSGSVYEWIQDVNAPIDSDGLVQILVRVKLRSQARSIDVDGRILDHVTCRDTNDKLVSVDDYTKALDDYGRSCAW
jgi:hypothetical protein